MTRLLCFLSVCLCAVLTQQGFSQPLTDDKHSIALQPVFWLDNLVPSELTALSIQFEAAVSNSEALAARTVWFRNPLDGITTMGVSGYAISLEYRHYLSTSTIGWHIGPFMEWVRYRYLGDLRDAYGSKSRSLIDFGAIGGHKWKKNKLIFDISVRTAWYSPSPYPRLGYFPRLPGSNLNSMMILTVGYSLD